MAEVKKYETKADYLKDAQVAIPKEELTAAPEDDD